MEVEAKYKVGSLDPVRRRLEELGARRVGTFLEEDVYLEHPCRSMADADEALRIRRRDGVLLVTYKGPRRGLRHKVREEVEMVVEGSPLLLFTRLGFRPVARVVKRREVYSLGAAAVMLDEVEGLGAFVEIEAAEGGEDAVDTVARELGLGEEVSKTYLELLLEAGHAPDGSRRPSPYLNGEDG